MTEQLRFGPFLQKMRERGTLVPERKGGEYNFSPDARLEERRKVSVAELGELISVSAQHISAVESGRSRPLSMIQMSMVADFLGVSVRLLGKRASFERDFELNLGGLPEGPQREVALEMMLRLSDPDASDVRANLPDELCEQILKALPELVTDELKAKREREKIKRARAKIERDAKAAARDEKAAEKAAAKRHDAAVEAGKLGDAAAVARFTLATQIQKEQETFAAKLSSKEAQKILRSKAAKDFTDKDVEIIIEAAKKDGINLEAMAPEAAVQEKEPSSTESSPETGSDNS